MGNIGHKFVLEGIETLQFGHQLGLGLFGQSLLVELVALGSNHSLLCHLQAISQGQRHQQDFEG